VKIQEAEYSKIRKQLIAVRLQYEPASNWAVLYANLVGFAVDNGFRVIESGELVSSRGSLGCIWPHLKIIAIQKCNVTKMVPTLAHENGHLICFKAGILRKYDFDEDLADRIGGVLFDILAK